MALAGRVYVADHSPSYERVQVAAEILTFVTFIATGQLLDKIIHPGTIPRYAWTSAVQFPRTAC